MLTPLASAADWTQELSRAALLAPDPPPALQVAATCSPSCYVGAANFVNTLIKLDNYLHRACGSAL